MIGNNSQEGIEGLTAYIPVFTCCESYRVLSALFQSSGGKQVLNLVMSVLPCLIPHGSARLPRDRFSRSLVFGVYTKLVDTFQVIFQSEKKTLHENVVMRQHELPEDDLNKIETCWSVFKCFKCEHFRLIFYCI